MYVVIYMVVTWSYAMGPYSHTTVPSRLSNRLLSETLAWTPDEDVIVPVSLFIFANSSLWVISCNPCAACPPNCLSVEEAYHPCFAVAIIVQVPTQKWHPIHLPLWLPELYAHSAPPFHGRGPVCFPMLPMVWVSWSGCTLWSQRMTSGHSIGSQLFRSSDITRREWSRPASSLQYLRRTLFQPSRFRQWWHKHQVPVSHDSTVLKFSSLFVWSFFN